MNLIYQACAFAVQVFDLGAELLFELVESVMQLSYTFFGTLIPFPADTL